MRSPEERWWSVRAGEYVLGTLRGTDLELFERILSSDTAMQAEVLAWERRLDGLRETTLARPPADDVWPRILERIREAETRPAVPVPAPGPDIDAADVDPPAGRRADVPPVTRDRSSAWRTVAGLATAASVLLGVLLYQRSADPPIAASLNVDGLAVVLSDESGEPYFLVETDYANGRVRVTALAPPELDDDRRFQLWQALPDRSSVRPVARLFEGSGRSRTFQVDTLIEGSDLFGVSLEPEGAPTDDGPVGPVVAHGDFLRTERAD